MQDFRPDFSRLFTRMSCAHAHRLATPCLTQRGEQARTCISLFLLSFTHLQVHDVNEV
jgi:hypothetical protein